MATIETAYASAQKASTELPIRDWSGLVKQPEVERMVRGPMIMNDCASRP